MQVNDIISRMGGWECTFYTYYRITKIQNGYVTLAQLKDEKITYEPFTGTLGSGTMAPLQELTDAKPFRKKIKYRKDGYTPYIQFNDREYGWLWDGVPDTFDFRNV
jgi:hypothetical protein